METRNLKKRNFEQSYRERRGIENSGRDDLRFVV